MGERLLMGGGACVSQEAAWDNKSIDCPLSSRGPNVNKLKKDGKQSRMVSETDILNRGPASNQMPLWLFPSSADACHSQILSVS